VFFDNYKYALHVSDALYVRRNTWYSLSEAESKSGHMVLSGEPRKISPVTPPGIEPGTVRLVAQREVQCINFAITCYVCTLFANYFIGKSVHVYCLMMSGFVSRGTYMISIYYMIGDLKVLTSKICAKLL
jgi:hypothetical protein